MKIIKKKEHNSRKMHFDEMILADFDWKSYLLEKIIIFIILKNKIILSYNL